MFEVCFLQIARLPFVESEVMTDRFTGHCRAVHHQTVVRLIEDEICVVITECTEGTVCGSALGR